MVRITRDRDLPLYASIEIGPVILQIGWCQFVVIGG
jgi:hypothetical protein